MSPELPVPPAISPPSLRSLLAGEQISRGMIRVQSRLQASGVGWVGGIRAASWTGNGLGDEVSEIEDLQQILLTLRR